MPREIIFDNIKHLSLIDAEMMSGYSSNYISRLCCEGKIKGKKIGKVWYVEAEGFGEFLHAYEIEKKRQKEELSQKRKVELEKTQEEIKAKERLERQRVEERKKQVERQRALSEEILRKKKFKLEQEKKEDSFRHQSVALPSNAPRLSQKLTTLALITVLAINIFFGFLIKDIPEVQAAYNKVVSNITEKVITTKDTVSETSVAFINTVEESVSTTYTKTITAYDALSDLIVKEADSLATQITMVTLRTLESSKDTLVMLTDKSSNSIAKTFFYTKDSATNLAALSLSSAQEVVQKSTNSLSNLPEKITAFVNTVYDKAILFFNNEKELVLMNTPTVADDVEQDVVALSRDPQEDVIQETEETLVPIVQATQPALPPPAVIERVVEKQAIVVQGITEAYVLEQLEQLNNKLKSEIYSLSATNAGNIVNNYNTIAQTNNIDKLGNATLNNTTVTGSFSGLTDAHIPDTITASNYLPLAGGTLTGALTASYFEADTSTATSTFAGGVLVTRIPSVPHTFSPWAIGTADSALYDASLVINPASATADSNLISAAVGGSIKFLVDAEGDIFANNLTSIGEVTLAETTASTFTVEGNTTLGDAISDVTTINGTLTVTGQTAVSTVDGNFGVGTTSPWARLSVSGRSTDSTTPLFTISSSTASATTTVFHIDNSGNVGVGTTSPLRRLSVTDAVSTGQFILSYNDTMYGDFLIDAVGDLTLDPSGNDIFINDDNFWICSGGACPAGTPVGTGNLVVENSLGIGSSTPWKDFSVDGEVAITSTTTFGNQFSLAPMSGTTTATGLFDNAGDLLIRFDQF